MSLANPSSSALLLALGLPLASGFATMDRTGTATSVAIATESGTGSGGYRPDVSRFPDDICTRLGPAGEGDGTFKVITDENTWCGTYKDEDSCNYVPKLKLREAHMSTTGTKVAYDLCDWDADFVKNGVTGKCRLASFSYLCHSSCTGVPANRARSASSANVVLVTSEKKKLVLQTGGNPAVRTWVTVTESEQNMVVGGRRLEVAEPKKKKQRRKLQGACVPMQNGVDVCCLGTYQVSDDFYQETIEYEEDGATLTTVGSRSSAGADPDEGAFYFQTQECTYDSATDDCSCTDPADGEMIALDDDVLCEESNGSPTPWGLNGGRRLAL
jgi:hypothetical protein